MISSRRPVDFVWLALVILGLGLLLLLGHDVGSLDPQVVLFALPAAVCWGAYIVFGKRVVHSHAGHSVALGLTVAVISSAVPISLGCGLKLLSQEAFDIMTSMEPTVAAGLSLLMP